ncbi:DNA internalization-related competence protein ComEC/Rec2 [Candidatus Sumerlaeota bacterium]|nr:DNA internalization-related competence protein ComEC/Rec2 [Candidatus Sumerlaeota bacterium]
MRTKQRLYHPAFAFPGVLAALSLLIGHILCQSFRIEEWRIGFIVAVCGAVLMVMGRRETLGFAYSFCMLFAGIGATQQAIITARDNFAFMQIEAHTDRASRNFEVRGRVARTPQRTATGWLIYLGDRTTLRGRGVPMLAGGLVAVRVSADDSMPMPFLVPPVIGDLVELNGNLRELPHSPSSGDPGSWMRARGAVVQVYASGKSPITITEAGGLQARFLRMSAAASVGCENVIANSLPREQAALLTAITIGKTHLLSDEQRVAFRRTGLLHLFSVSGLHTVLVGGFLVYLLRLCGLRPWTRFVLLLMTLMFFAALVGMASPVIRAALLLLLNEARQFLRRPVEPLAALGTVAAVLIMMSPRLPWQVDFQMTFLCAVALVMMSQWSVALKMLVGRKLGWGWRSSVVANVVQVIAASVLIQVILLPIFANEFGEVSLIAPLANALLLQLASYLVIAGFIMLLFWAAFPLMGEHLIALLQWPLWVLDWGAQLLARIPCASMGLRAWPLWMTALLYLVLAASAFVRFNGQRSPRRTPWQFIPAAMLVAVMLAAQPVFERGDGKLHIWFLDVGQGDATLLRFPDRTAALVDAGPQSMAWVLPGMIKRRGVERLSFAIATHADADHIGGMNEILEAVPTDVLMVGGSLAATSQFADLAETVRKGYLPVVTINRGAEFETQDGLVRFSVLHPTPEFSSDASSTNDASVVLRIDYAGRSVLLTGDATREVEGKMLDAGLLTRMDVLKVGHHGSGSSTGNPFLDVVAPRLAIISCGKNNQYRHPSPATMERLAAHSVTAHRTDNDGTIHLTIDRLGEMSVEATKMSDVALR